MREAQIRHEDSFGRNIQRIRHVFCDFYLSLLHIGFSTLPKKAFSLLKNARIRACRGRRKLVLCFAVLPDYFQQLGLIYRLFFLLIMMKTNRLNKGNVETWSTHTHLLTCNIVTSMEHINTKIHNHTSPHSHVSHAYTFSHILTHSHTFSHTTFHTFSHILTHSHTFWRISRISRIMQARKYKYAHMQTRNRITHHT